ncbi:hypothetical protein FQR65_LT17660 [Abscondita terminalis]|nr:hypothetical protein FQR65_LT17660 [Abscondita terminalis]
MDLFNVYPINPINIVKAKGSTVWDAAGNAYLDLYGGHAVISIGHTHPHYVRRLTDQLNEIGFYSNFGRNPNSKRKLARLTGEVSADAVQCVMDVRDLFTRMIMPVSGTGGGGNNYIKLCGQRYGEWFSDRCDQYCSEVQSCLCMLGLLRWKSSCMCSCSGCTEVIKQKPVKKCGRKVRGRGLMIGIDLPEDLSTLKKELLEKEKIFTGEAKPNVIRLLPALNITKAHADQFLEAFDRRVKALRIMHMNKFFSVDDYPESF